MNNEKLIFNQVYFNSILSDFKMLKQWLSLHSYESVVKYSHILTAKIELLEVQQCGSIGGFDKGQTTTNSLVERFSWICKKNDVTIPDEIKSILKSLKSFNF